MSYRDYRALSADPIHRLIVRDEGDDLHCPAAF